MIHGLLVFADSVLCNSWLDYGNAYGFELSTLRDCYTLYHGSSGGVYASGSFHHVSLHWCLFYVY